jgi:putative membrane protein
MHNDVGMGFGFGWILGIIVLVVLILLMFKAFHQKRNPHKRYRKRPVDILKKQFAQGELDKDEFDKRNGDLL